MTNRKRQNGFILMLVVAMIPLIGMVLVLMAANSKILTFQTRSAELNVRAKNACQSGLGWIEQNPANINALSPGNPLTLTLEDKTPKIYCLIERIRQDTGQDTLQITGYAEEGNLSANCRRQQHFSK